MEPKNEAQDRPPRVSRSSLALLLILGGFGLGLLGGPWLFAYIALHPPTLATGHTPLDPPALAYHDVSFTTADGLVLRGWHLPGQNGATVILVHGFARERGELLPEARWLVKQGYSALLFDSRAQGASDGAHISLGYLEALDIRAAVDFVLERSPGERIGVMGYSMGAVAAIQAAAEDTRIQAVIAVSPFATLRASVDHRLARLRPLAPLITWWGERMTGLRLDDLRPVDVVAALSPRPILIMQAGGDKMVPPDSGRRLYEAAAAPKELWSVPGVAHVDFRQAVPEPYQRRMIDFFQRYLLPDA
jgi:alpha-beta hydrolase superfamily lysophospholipase